MLPLNKYIQIPNLFNVVVENFDKITKNDDLEFNYLQENLNIVENFDYINNNQNFNYLQKKIYS